MFLRTTENSAKRNSKNNDSEKKQENLNDTNSNHFIKIMRISDIRNKTVGFLGDKDALQLRSIARDFHGEIKPFDYSRQYAAASYNFIEGNCVGCCISICYCNSFGYYDNFDIKPNSLFNDWRRNCYFFICHPCNTPIPRVTGTGLRLSSHALGSIACCMFGLFGKVYGLLSNIRAYNGEIIEIKNPENSRKLPSETQPARQQML